MLTYQDTADNLVNLILKLIPEFPQILEMESAWDLFKIEKFKKEYDKLPGDSGTNNQAQWALSKAQEDYLGYKYGKK